MQLRRREAAPDTALPTDFHPLLRRLYAQRGIGDARELERGAKFLHPWQGLSGMQQAVELLHQALRDQKQIMIVGDFDADGATSTALTVLALRSMGGQHVQYLVPNRFDDGYGLSHEVVEQAAARGAELILTVDNGISSHAGVLCAHQKGIPVLVTDHHLPGETLPEAEAIVNPNLDDSTFPSRALAGVGVELDAIASVVIGGTLLSGGVGTVLGTLFGVAIQGLIQTYINFDGTLSSWWTKIAIGILLFIFIALQRGLTVLWENRQNAAVTRVGGGGESLTGNSLPAGREGKVEIKRPGTL